MERKQTSRIYTVKQIKRILNKIEYKAIEGIDKAHNSGAIAEDSDFIKINSLLAMLLIEDAALDYKITLAEYKKEADNIKRFI